METMEGMKRTHHCGELRATKRRPRSGIMRLGFSPS